MQRLVHTLKAHIQFSQRIEDILAGDALYSDPVHYDLHRALSNQQPDSALISIALAALDIVNSVSAVSFHYPSLSILKMEAGRILEEYGPLWLQNARCDEVDSQQALELLKSVPEDLDFLSLLLERCRDTLDAPYELQACMLDILKIQSGAQSLIAQDYVDTLCAGIEEQDAQSSAPAIASGSNVIPFPAYAVRN